MNNLQAWADRHGITPAAFEELCTLLSPNTDPERITAPNTKPMSEARVQQLCRVEASKCGMRLWRNNNGACVDENGNHIRYGICNDSAKLNKKLKSSDLIGITPYIVKPEDVGKQIGVFTTFEVKPEGWEPGKRKADEKAQQAFITLVQSMGGFGKFISHPDQIREFYQQL